MPHNFLGSHHRLDLVTQSRETLVRPIGGRSSPGEVNTVRMETLTHHKRILWVISSNVID